MRHFSLGKRNQPDTSAPTNCASAAGSWRNLKSVGRREYNNVIGNFRMQDRLKSQKTLKTFLDTREDDFNA